MNAKRVYRVYRALRLSRPRRAKRRVPTRELQPLAAPAALNRTWAVDFMSDTLYDGRRFVSVRLSQVDAVSAVASSGRPAGWQVRP